MNISSIGATRIQSAVPSSSHKQFSELVKTTEATASKHQAIAAQVAPQSAQTVHVLDSVSQAQQRMDAVLKLAESGRNFTGAELLALQTRVYRANQELDLAGKVVEKATGGVKQVLQTQV